MLSRLLLCCCLLFAIPSFSLHLGYSLNPVDPYSNVEKLPVKPKKKSAKVKKIKKQAAPAIKADSSLFGFLGTLAIMIFIVSGLALIVVPNLMGPFLSVSLLVVFLVLMVGLLVAAVFALRHARRLEKQEGEPSTEKLQRRLRNFHIILLSSLTAIALSIFIIAAVVNSLKFLILCVLIVLIFILRLFVIIDAAKKDISPEKLRQKLRVLHIVSTILIVIFALFTFFVLWLFALLFGGPLDTIIGWGYAAAIILSSLASWNILRAIYYRRKP